MVYSAIETGEEIVETENAPDVVTDSEKLDRIIVQNERILGILEPLSDFVTNDLPELKEKVGPILDGLSNNPMLKMLLR